MADLNITLTQEEAAFALNELHSAGHGHGSSNDDFEPECPSCTAAEKLAAAVTGEVKDREPDAEFLRLLALCETSYYTATRALDVPAVDVEQCRAHHARARADLIAHVFGVGVGGGADAAWVRRLRETATHLRENSLSLAKYPGMAEEARARELAALYIQEIADLHEAKRALGVLEGHAPSSDEAARIAFEADARRSYPDVPLRGTRTEHGYINPVWHSDWLLWKRAWDAARGVGVVHAAEFATLLTALEAAVFATGGDPAHPEVVKARDAVRAAHGVTVDRHQTFSQDTPPPSREKGEGEK